MPHRPLATGFLHLAQRDKIAITVRNTEAYITDSISFRVQNRMPDTIGFTISLEVLTENRWQEVYANIFEPDRDVVKLLSLNPNEQREFRYPITNIHKDYQQTFSGKWFRLVVNRTHEGTVRNVTKFVSKAFRIKRYLVSGQKTRSVPLISGMALAQVNLLAHAGLVTMPDTTP